MESAQELSSVGTWNGDESTSKVAIAAADALREAGAARVSIRWLGAVVALQLVLLGGVAYMTFSVREQLASMHHAQAAQQDATAKELQALADDTKTLTSQVQGVRGLLASSTAEDVIFLKIMVLKPNIDPTFARKVATSIHHYAQQFGRDPDLVLAIMTIESGFDPNATSSVGATGLMQVMPHWKKVLAIEGDLRDPDVSIKYGLQILAFYEQMYKDLDMALTAYNRGPGPVDRALMKGSDPKNDYAPRVLSVYDRLKKLKAGVAPQTTERL